MYLLVTIQVHESEVAVAASSPLTARLAVVDVERFVIKERRATHQAVSLLGRGELAQAGGQELSFAPLALLPVLPQRWVIRGGRAFD